MQHNLSLCVYCETTPDELVRLGRATDALEALVWLKVGEFPLLLCHQCVHDHAPASAGIEENYMELLDGPIEFPPGVTAVEHTCPELQYQGKDDEEATFILEMHREDTHYWATCKFCGVEVRSRAVDGPLSTEEGVQDGGTEGFEEPPAGIDWED